MNVIRKCLICGRLFKTPADQPSNQCDKCAAFPKPAHAVIAAVA